MSTIKLSAVGREVKVGDFYNYFQDKILSGELKVPNESIDVRHQTPLDMKSVSYSNLKDGFKAIVLDVSSHIIMSLTHGFLNANDVWFASYLTSKSNQPNVMESVVTLRVIQRTETLSPDFLQPKMADCQRMSDGRATHVIEQVVYGAEFICCIQVNNNGASEIDTERIWKSAEAYFDHCVMPNMDSGHAQMKIMKDIEQLSCSLWSSLGDCRAQSGSLRQCCQWIRSAINSQNYLGYRSSKWRPVYIILRDIPRQLEVRIQTERAKDVDYMMAYCSYRIEEKSLELLTHPLLDNIPPLRRAVCQFYNLQPSLWKHLEQMRSSNSINVANKSESELAVLREKKAISKILVDMLDWIDARRREFEMLCNLLGGIELDMADLADIEAGIRSTTDVECAEVFVLKVDYKSDPLIERIVGVFGCDSTLSAMLPVFPVTSGGKHFERVQKLLLAFARKSKQNDSSRKISYHIGLVSMNSRLDDGHQTQIKNLNYRNLRPAVQVESIRPFQVHRLNSSTEGKQEDSSSSSLSYKLDLSPPRRSSIPDRVKQRLSLGKMRESKSTSHLDQSTDEGKQMIGARNDTTKRNRNSEVRLNENSKSTDFVLLNEAPVSSASVASKPVQKAVDKSVIKSSKEVPQNKLLSSANTIHQPKSTQYSSPTVAEKPKFLKSTSYIFSASRHPTESKGTSSKADTTAGQARRNIALQFDQKQTRNVATSITNLSELRSTPIATKSIKKTITPASQAQNKVNDDSVRGKSIGRSSNAPTQSLTNIIKYFESKIEHTAQNVPAKSSLKKATSTGALHRSSVGRTTELNPPFSVISPSSIEKDNRIPTGRRRSSSEISISSSSTSGIRQELISGNIKQSHRRSSLDLGMRLSDSRTTSSNKDESSSIMLEDRKRSIRDNQKLLDIGVNTISKQKIPKTHTLARVKSPKACNGTPKQPLTSSPIHREVDVQLSMSPIASPSRKKEYILSSQTSNGDDSESKNSHSTVINDTGSKENIKRSFSTEWEWINNDNNEMRARLVEVNRSPNKSRQSVANWLAECSLNRSDASTKTIPTAEEDSSPTPAPPRSRRILEEISQLPLQGNKSFQSKRICEVFAEGDGAHSKLIERGHPSTYQLNATERSLGADLRWFEIGAPSDVRSLLPSGNTISDNHKVIILMGATGCGKSTLVNGMVNYILGVKWKDPFRFKVIREDESESRNQAHSQTTSVTAYTLHHKPGMTVPYSITIIDTPGYGDTRGVARDKEITRSIHRFLTEQSDRVDRIHAACFVAASGDSRLTATQRYILDSVLSVFGKDVKDNIRLLVTFADNADPPVVDACSAAHFPVPSGSTDGITYSKFNSSVLYAQKQVQCNENDGEEDFGFDELFWDMGQENFEKFFRMLEGMKSRNLGSTREVIRQRRDVESSLKTIELELENCFVTIEKMEALKIKLKVSSTNQAAAREILAKCERALRGARSKVLNLLRSLGESGRCLDEKALRSNALTPADYLALMRSEVAEKQQPGYMTRLETLTDIQRILDADASLPKVPVLTRGVIQSK